jgi:hypothetical protein
MRASGSSVIGNQSLRDSASPDLHGKGKLCTVFRVKLEFVNQQIALLLLVPAPHGQRRSVLPRNDYSYQTPFKKILFLYFDLRPLAVVTQPVAPWILVMRRGC